MPIHGSYNGHANTIWFQPGLFEPFGGKRINNFKGHADAHDDDDDDGDGDGDCDDGDGDHDDDDDDDDDAWHKQG